MRFLISIKIKFKTNESIKRNLLFFRLIFFFSIKQIMQVLIPTLKRHKINKDGITVVRIILYDKKKIELD